MNEMNLLNVQQLIDFNTAQMIWKAKHGLAPEYISEMFVPIRSVHDHNTRKAEHGFHPTKRTWILALEAFRIMDASYGMAFLGMFRLQPVSLILRKSLQISSKESRM